jgi:hypothetical protein
MVEYFKTFEVFTQDNKDSNYKIFCDMDGVLTNFVDRFLELESNPERLTPEEYDKKHGKYSMWDIIDLAGIEWWTGMNWMPDGQKLWTWLMPYKPTILSAPSKNPNSRDGKMIWIKNHLNIKQSFYTVNPNKWRPHYRIILNSQKHLFVRDKFDILIDDTASKVAAWKNAGGTAILHTNTNNTITELKKILY